VRELLFNVVKHGATRTARVELGAGPAPGVLRVAVSDEGRGFGSADSVHGSGFGLLSIRERLGYLGGALDVESSPGHGARVVLEVPGSAPGPVGEAATETGREAPGAAADRAGSAEPAARGKRRLIRVLLVDDHQVIRQGLARLLQGQPGLQVAGEAGDGQEAIEMERRTRPDVILMDVSMPGLNGIEATRAILKQNPAARVIGLSMHDDVDMAATLIAAGAVAYLNKSGPAEKLVDAIRAAAGR